MSHYSRHLDWSAVKGDAARSMRLAVLRFVRGIRGERKTEVTRAQILAWFSATPAAFVEDAILDAVTRDEVQVFRAALGRASANARYIYVLTDLGREAIRAMSCESIRTRSGTVE